MFIDHHHPHPPEAGAGLLGELAGEVPGAGARELGERLFPLLTRPPVLDQVGLGHDLGGRGRGREGEGEGEREREIEQCAILI